MNDAFKTTEAQIIATHDMLYHEEYLCLTKLPNAHWLLDIRVYDCSDQSVEDFMDEETGEVELPNEIDGYKVLGVDEVSQVILINRLIPHLNERIAKIQYQFIEFDCQEFTKRFSSFNEKWCESEVITAIDKAVSRSDP